MNEKKVYKEIFDQIIKNATGQKQILLNENMTLISPNGYYGFVFHKNNLPFNLERIPISNGKLDLFNIVKPENKCKLTNRFVMSKHKILGMLRILQKEDYEIFVQQKFLQYFDCSAEFYQEKNLQIIVVVEFGQVVGCILPVRFTEGETE